MKPFKEIQERFQDVIPSKYKTREFEIRCSTKDAPKIVKLAQTYAKKNKFKFQAIKDEEMGLAGMSSSTDIFVHNIDYDPEAKELSYQAWVVVAGNEKSKRFKEVDLTDVYKNSQKLPSAMLKQRWIEEQVGNKTDNGVHEIGSDDILASYQADTPGEIETSYLKDVNEFIEISEKKKKEQVKAHFAMVFDNPLQGFPYNEQFGMDKNLTEKPVKREEIAEMTKSKLKIDTKILKDLKKLEKSEKGMNDKEVKWVHDFFKKGVEVVQDGDGEPKHISNQALNKFDPVWGKMDTMVRDSIYSIMRKHSDEALSAILSPYGA